MMHGNSKNLMKDAVGKYLEADKGKPLRILDVGSRDVNGTYRDFFDVAGWEYVGLDMEGGKNVDIVVCSDDWATIPSESFDVVISGQCLEHCEMPWVIAKSIERVCKPGGLAIVIAPWQHNVHRHPVDCWRILEDGMRAMMTKYVAFDELECFMESNDTIFVGRKRSVQRQELTEERETAIVLENGQTVFRF